MKNADSKKSQDASVAVQKFAIACGRVGSELLNQSHTSAAGEDEIFVWVRRQWNDRRIGKVRLADLGGFHWSQYSGGEVHGFGRVAPRPFLHAYMLCTQILEGAIAHTCRHGPPPHRIKVCIAKKDNRRAFGFLQTLADPDHSLRSVRRKHRRAVAQRTKNRLIFQISTEGYSTLPKFNSAATRR